ncbi:MAG: hypothetical protein QXE31_01365 [Candidatus Woesearchaeota archaeon]
MADEIIENNYDNEMEILVDEEAPIIIDEGEWKPKTELGKKVASGEITDINFMLF